MALTYSPPELELAPAGIHPAYGYGVIDFGTHPNKFDDKLKRRIQFKFELAIEERRTDGRPFWVARSFNYNWHALSSMRQTLESWRGRKFTNDDRKKFDLASIAGAKCILTLQHDVRDERDVCDIIGIAPASSMKGIVFQPMLNEKEVLILEPDQFDQAVLDKQSDKVRELIEKSPEYLKLKKKPPQDGGSTPAAPTGGPDDLDDEIPF